MVTSARFFTSPRSSQRRAPFLNQLGEASTVFVYVPTPEKYLTPGSSLWLQSKSSFMVMELGAPRPDWKTIFQGPLIVATFVVVTSGIVCEVLDVLRRRSEEHTSELQSPYDLVC